MADSNNADEQPPKNKGGRPTKLTPRLLELADEFSVQGLTDGGMCRILKISQEAFYKWMRIGRASTDPKDPYYKFFDIISANRGYWELAQIKKEDKVKLGGRWLLAHNPITKEDWADYSQQKSEVKTSIADDEWVRFKSIIIEALADYPEAKKKLSEKLLGIYTNSDSDIE